MDHSGSNVVEHFAEIFTLKIKCVRGEIIPLPDPPSDLVEEWGDVFMKDCMGIVGMLAQAYETRIRLKWDMDIFTQSSPAQQRKSPNFHRRFPPISSAPFIVLDFPSVIVDRHDRIVCWHLPRILPRNIQDSTLRATSMLRPVISKPSRASRAEDNAAELSEDLQSKKHWRENPIHFRFKAACRIPPGLVDISPAWFNQGRTPARHTPGPSAAFQKLKERQVLPTWTAETRQLNAIADLILRITHPDLYYRGQAAREVLAEKVNDAEVKNWPTVWNGVSAIINRQTPRHNDGKSWKSWPDILVTVGDYAEADLELQDVGVRLSYYSGTIVVVCGTCITHGVEASDGERLCIAYYMRRTIYEYVGIGFAHWATLAAVADGKKAAEIVEKLL